jgi:protein TonB
MTRVLPLKGFRERGPQGLRPSATGGPTGAEVVPLFGEKRVLPLRALPERPLSLPRLSRKPLLATVAVSLLLHGAALAAFFGLDEGATVEVGSPIMVEVVMLSPAGGSEAGGDPETEAAPLEAAAAPQPPERNSLPAQPPKPRAKSLPAPAPAPQPRQAELTPPIPMAEPVTQRPTAQLAEAAEPSPLSRAPAPLDSTAETPAPQASAPTVAPPPEKPAAPETRQAAQSASLPSAAGTAAEQTPTPPAIHGEGAGVPGQEGASGGSDASPLAGNAPPEYPFLARKKGQEGLVLVLAKITDEGWVENVSLAKSSGHSSLDEAALAAVRQWRFQPALQNGRPVSSSLEQPIRFRLDD